MRDPKKAESELFRLLAANVKDYAKIMRDRRRNGPLATSVRRSSVANLPASSFPRLCGNAIMKGWRTGMPGMDGNEVARRLRAMTELQDTVLAAVTGWGQPEDRRLSAEAGLIIIW